MKHIKLFEYYRLNEELENIILFHGSKNKFSEFDETKFGEGEGSGLFGNGFYLTDNPEIANFYAIQVAKKDHIIKYDKGIFDTPNPIFSKDAVEKAKKSAHVNKFKISGNILNVESFIIDDKFKNYITEIFEKHSGWGNESSSIVEDTFKYMRNNKHKIRNYRGELIYVIDRLCAGDQKMIADLVFYIKNIGYDGIKYPSDKSFENLEGYNYIIFNKNIIKPV